jgi:hypothetical protein
MPAGKIHLAHRLSERAASSGVANVAPSKRIQIYVHDVMAEQRLRATTGAGWHLIH